MLRYAPSIRSFRSYSVSTQHERVGWSELLMSGCPYHPGGGRGLIGEVDVTGDRPLSSPFPNWAPAFAGVVLAKAWGSNASRQRHSRRPFRLREGSGEGLASMCRTPVCTSAPPLTPPAGGRGIYRRRFAWSWAPAFAGEQGRRALPLPFSLNSIEVPLR